MLETHPTFQPIENILSRWSGKCLSYEGRIQLFNWIIAGNYTYWAQGVALPSSVHKKIQKLVYHFIWDGRKGIPWSQMALPKEEGGLGVRSLFMIALATPVRKAAGLSEKHSVLSSWMQQRYIKGRALQDIKIRPTIDSSQWKELMASKRGIETCLECRAGSIVIWKVGEGKKI